MNNRVIPPPVTGGEPDAFTGQAPDYTGPRANNRILHIDFRWLRYGTDDKGHAAALTLSGLILTVVVIISVVSFGFSLVALAGGTEQPQLKWIEILVTWLGNAFLFTAGIAVGGGAAKSKETPPTE